jgi:hypothetical protein
MLCSEDVCRFPTYQNPTLYRRFLALAQPVKHNFKEISLDIEFEPILAAASRVETSVMPHL